jgi:hypothetical protein
MPKQGEDSERRANPRFPIEREVQYRPLNGKRDTEWGGGATVNMSNASVFFSCETPVTLGKRLEVAISWPVQLDGTCRLKLVATGKVVRCEGRHVAIAIERYEFRTVGSKKP